MENNLVLTLCALSGCSVISTRSTCRVLILTSGLGALLLQCLFACDLFRLGCLLKMFVFLNEMHVKAPTPLIWSLKPYGLAVPSSLFQNSSLVLQNEVNRAGFLELW